MGGEEVDEEGRTVIRGRYLLWKEASVGSYIMAFVDRPSLT